MDKNKLYNDVMRLAIDELYNRGVCFVAHASRSGGWFDLPKDDVMEYIKNPTEYENKDTQ